MKILIVGGESPEDGSLGELLGRKGYEVRISGDAGTAEAYARMGVCDLLILDTLPGTDGCHFVRRLRANRCPVPVLMLTARPTAEGRIQGLEAGADYCLTKPVDPHELLACAEALLRRQEGQSGRVSFGNTELDLDSCMLICGKRSVRLSAREFDVMRLLMQSRERNLAKETILVRVWGFESNATENHVEVYVGFLRRKLNSIGSDIRIEAIRREGYHLENGGRIQPDGQ